MSCFSVVIIFFLWLEMLNIIMCFERDFSCSLFSVFRLFMSGILRFNRIRSGLRDFVSSIFCLLLFVSLIMVIFGVILISCFMLVRSIGWSSISRIVVGFWLFMGIFLDVCESFFGNKGDYYFGVIWFMMVDVVIVS